MTRKDALETLWEAFLVADREFKAERTLKNWGVRPQLIETLSNALQDK